MQLELKSYKGSYSDFPLHARFETNDGVMPALFDDLCYITGIMDNNRTPTIAQFNSVFD